MDMQKFVDTMNEIGAKTRSGYHLTYGDLVKALLAAPKTAKFDKRIKGIGSYRGYYTDIALFTEDAGYHVEDQEMDWSADRPKGWYEKWQKEHVTSSSELPTNANKLGKLLESFIGQDFIGYKGGNFKITEGKPLWFENESSNCSERAVIGIENDMTLITKRLAQED